jgi:hypothetical protein
VSLRVVGAGLGRTGTHSLKVALEQLLGGRCYHMLELIERPAETPAWHAALRGQPVDWDALLSDFVATVDWPACAFWGELHAANPDAVVLLSTRESAEAWWESMETTIFSVLSRPVPPEDTDRVERRAMITAMMERFNGGGNDRESAIAAYERHNSEVRRGVPAGQLVDWKPGDGWEPICAALDLPIPAEPFPHTNTGADFRSAQGLEAEGEAESPG